MYLIKNAGFIIPGIIWEGVKDSAWESRESASAYLEKLIKSGGKDSKTAPKKPIEPPVRKEAPKPEMSVKERAVGQAKLDADREAREIKRDKITKVKARGVQAVDMGEIQSLMGRSGGYSKEHQTRKKGK